MAGTRVVLFGIACILCSGFVVLHDLLRYGAEGGPQTPLFQVGLFVGLLVSLLGTVYGAYRGTAPGPDEG